MTEAKHIIYGLVDPRTRMVRYVGCSARGMARPREHFRAPSLNDDHTHKGRWVRKAIAAGNPPEIVVLAESTRRDLFVDERWWIAYAKASAWPITNLTAGGEGLLGFVHSPEAREKMAAANRGRVVTLEQRVLLRAANLGKKMGPASAERRAKVSAALKGRVMTPEWIEKVAAKNRGRRASPEARARMSESRRGRKMPPGFGEKTRARLSGVPKSPEHREKIRQTLVARMASRTHCKHGHEFTPSNVGYSKTKIGNPMRYCLICARARYARFDALRRVKGGAS